MWVGVSWRDFRASGIPEAPPAERSVHPKCTESKLKLNGGQCVCDCEEKSLTFLGESFQRASNFLQTSVGNGSSVQLRKSHQV